MKAHFASKHKVLFVALTQKEQTPLKQKKQAPLTLTQLKPPLWNQIALATLMRFLVYNDELLDAKLDGMRKLIDFVWDMSKSGALKPTKEELSSALDIVSDARVGLEYRRWISHYFNVAENDTNVYTVEIGSEAQGKTLSLCLLKHTWTGSF